MTAPMFSQHLQEAIAFRNGASSEAWRFDPGDDRAGGVVYHLGGLGWF
jgi:hypothetical protein